MDCHSCGTTVRTGSRFCTACGTPLRGATPRPGPVPPPAEVQGFEIDGLPGSQARAVSLPPGHVLGSLRIRRKLGQGVLGAVYLADQLQLGRPVAVKVLPGRLTQVAQAIGRFRQEAQILATLEHPHIIAIYDMFELDQLFCIVVSYADGGSLKDLIRQRGRLEEREAAALAAQVADGLWAAACKQVVHRDIKPDNLLLTASSQVKIADFGLAKITQGGSDLTTPGAPMGTPDYMSPEQWTDPARVDHRSDLYSLGCTLYEMLIGRPPFSAPSLMGLALCHRNVPAQDVRRVHPEISPQMAAIVGRLLQKDPARRLQNGAALMQALQQLSQTSAALGAGAGLTAEASLPPAAAPPPVECRLGSPPPPAEEEDTFLALQSSPAEPPRRDATLSFTADELQASLDRMRASQGKERSSVRQPSPPPPATPPPTDDFPEAPDPEDQATTVLIQRGAPTAALPEDPEPEQAEPSDPEDAPTAPMPHPVLPNLRLIEQSAGDRGPEPATPDPVSERLQGLMRLQRPGKNQERLLLVPGAEVFFGRNHQSGDDFNPLVLRALPCRSPDKDPENYRATHSISGRHGCFTLSQEGARLLAIGRAGMSAAGHHMACGSELSLPEVFDLDVGLHALKLRGYLIFAGPSTERILQALYLQRLNNLPSHSYVLLQSSVGFTFSDGHLQVLPPEHPQVAWLLRRDPLLPDAYVLAGLHPGYFLDDQPLVPGSWHPVRKRQMLRFQSHELLISQGRSVDFITI